MITAAAFAAFALIIAVMVKLIPSISIWEMTPESEATEPAKTASIQGPLSHTGPGSEL